MANTREIKSRMSSNQDTMKITNAMYMISSTKLRKARKNLEETEPYFYTLQAVIARIMRHLPEVESVYFQARTKKKPQERVKAFVVITADKGLAGAYNHNVLKQAQDQINACENYRLFVVGELGRQYFKNKSIPVAEQFLYTAQNPSLHRARIIGETVIEQFKDGEIDEVYVIYTAMKNSLTTETRMTQLLPMEKEKFLPKDVSTTGVYLEELDFTPSPEAVLDNIAPDLVEGTLYGALIESFCSEQNARMMAMEAANKSASAMIHELAIEYNRVRQAMITQEITEVISGAKAQKRKKKVKKEA
jgi:F-type H+-transporting ATPase subunit gamma